MKHFKIIIPLILFVSLAFPLLTSYTELLFDEVWYVSAARLFLSSTTYERLEHPPLGQLLIASGIVIFGDNPLGWRIFSFIHGISSLVIVYLIVLNITKNETFALTSSLLLTTEKMFFSFSLLGVLDIFFIFFSLLSIYSALKKRILISAMSISAGLCCKLTAAFFIPVILVILYKNTSFTHKFSMKINKIMSLIKWFAYSTISFFTLLYLCDSLYSTTNSETILDNPITHLSYLINIHALNNWPSGYGEPPWSWIFTPQNYYLGRVSLIPHLSFLETFNPLLYGIIFLAFPTLLWTYYKKRDFTSKMLLVWFSSTYLLWIPLFFIVSRPLFSFYLLPTIPAICIIVILFVNGDKKIQYIFASINVIFFLFFQYPIHMFF